MQNFFHQGTYGSGEVLPQYRKTSDGQGLASVGQRVSCGICGFRGANLDKHDHSGGSLDGNGAGGAVISDGNGNGYREYKTGSGCPLCFSRAYFKTDRRDEFLESKPYSDRLA